MKYTLTLPQSRSIRGNHTVDPKFQGSTIATLTVNTTAGGDEVWECTQNGEYLNSKIGDKWLHIVTPTDGWVAVIHAGVVQCKLVENTNQPVTFPQKCVWQNVDETHPDFGKKAEYGFIREITD